MSDERNALVPAASAALGTPAVMSEGAQAFAAEAKGELEKPTGIPLVKVQHGDAKFLLPGGELVDEIAGYPILYFRTRSYYKKSFKPGDKDRPDCYSQDMVAPAEASPARQSDLCANCKMNQFGTGRDGRSMACATHLWIFLASRVFGNPPIGVLRVGPSSLRRFLGTNFQQGYFAQAAARHGNGRYYQTTWTTFRLQPAGDNDQAVYCLVEPVMGPPADEEHGKVLAGLRNQFLDAMNAIRETTPDVAPEEE